MMNQTAQRLGMTQTTYVNPNGLPADGQVTSARDLAILARAVIRDLPEYEYFMHIPAIRFGRRVTQQFQPPDRTLSRRRRLQDRFHLRLRLQPRGVGHAQRQAADRSRARRFLRSGARGARRPTAGARLRRQRPVVAAAPRWARWTTLSPIDANRRRTCATRCATASASGRPATMMVEMVAAGGSASATGGEAAATFFTAGLQAPMRQASEMLNTNYPVGEPMVVYTGPKKSGTGLIAAVATDSQSEATRRGKRARVAAKPDAGAAEAKPKTEARASRPPNRLRSPRRNLQQLPPPSRGCTHAAAESRTAPQSPRRQPAARPRPSRPSRQRQSRIQRQSQPSRPVDRRRPPRDSKQLLRR